MRKEIEMPQMKELDLARFATRIILEFSKIIILAQHPQVSDDEFAARALPIITKALRAIFREAGVEFK